MAEQLSQSQIDALLKRMSSGEMDVQEPTRKIREYDFRSPKKFTKEQLKALDSLHETFSRMVASYFSGLLSTACEIEVVQIEEQRYYEYSSPAGSASDYPAEYEAGKSQLRRSSCNHEYADEHRVLFHRPGAGWSGYRIQSDPGLYRY